MKELIILNPKSRPPQSWHPPSNLIFLAGSSLLPVQASEVGSLAADLPLALFKDSGERSGWSLMAVCGRNRGHNELIDEEGRWQSAAAPRCLAYLPFALRRMGEDHALMAINQNYGESLLARAETGEPLYDNSGSLHPSAQKRVENLLSEQPNIGRTQQILSQIKGAGLIRPWSADLLSAGGFTLEGLHTIDEKKLAQLDDETFLAMRNSGALAVAYSCLLSLYQVRKWIRKPSEKKAVSDKAVRTTGDFDLDFLNDSETIKFGPMH